ADMNQLGRAAANAVTTEESSANAMEQHFEHAGVIAKDRSPRDFFVSRDSGFIGDALTRQLRFGRTNHRYLRDRVDSDREVVTHGFGGHAEHVARGESPLFARRRRECGKPQHVTCSEYIGHVRLIALVHNESTTIVCAQTGSVESEIAGRADAT